MYGKKSAKTTSQPHDGKSDRPPPIPHLIFVHGTGAGDETDFGERWWQRGSPFRDDLSQRLDIDPACAVVRPFMWGKGPNFESERRSAGRGLLEELRELDKAGADYYLIGHSHGGSVIHSALLEGTRRGEALKGLKMWCTVGTPFLDYRANRWLFQRLNRNVLPLFGACFLMFLIAAIAFFTTVLDPAYYTFDRMFITVIIAIILIVMPGAITLWAFYLWEKKHNPWFSRRQKAELAKQHSDTWIGFYHKEDEAISALDNVRHLDDQIIPENFLDSFAAVIQLASLAVFGLILVNAMFIVDASELPSWTYFELGQMNFALEITLMLLVLFALFFLLVSGAYVTGILFQLFAWVVGPPLACGLNKLIWSSIRKKSWGDDLPKEDVGAITAHPPEFSNRFGPLPDVISAPLSTHADTNAIRALQKVRVVLGMTEERQKSLGLTSELSEALVWEELIHTSYFTVPEFVDLLAIALSNAGFAETKDGFTLGEKERADLTEWLLGALRTRVPEALDPSSKQS